MSVTELNEVEGIHKIAWAWTSAAGGAATIPTTRTYTGAVYTVITDPGTTAPDDNYDITITDSDGYDVLQGNGADRDTSTTEYLHLRSHDLGVVVNSTLTLNVSGAGSSKIGTVVLYLM